MKKLLVLMLALMVFGSVSVYAMGSGGDAGSGDDRVWDWAQYFNQLRYNKEQAQQAE